MLTGSSFCCCCCCCCDFLLKPSIHLVYHRSRRGESLGFVATPRLHDPSVFGGRSGPFRLPQIRLQSRTSQHAQFLPGGRFSPVYDSVDERPQSGSHLARFQEPIDDHVRKRKKKKHFFIYLLLLLGCSAVCQSRRALYRRRFPSSFIVILFLSLLFSTDPS